MLVSWTTARWMVFIFRLSRPVMPPRTTTPTKKTGTSAQCLVTAYQTKKATPTSEENRTPTNELMNFSLSDFTFCSMERTWPLLVSSNSW